MLEPPFVEHTLRKDKFQDILDLLVQLIETPSFSRQEDQTANILMRFFSARGSKCRRLGNNVICEDKYFDVNKPTLLLNSHHDTVKPAPGYSNDPFQAIFKDNKLFGLGSNDAGAALVSLVYAYEYFKNLDGIPFNLMLVASAEEEISGSFGIEYVMKEHQEVSFLGAIVGEPTDMKAAVAEKGLMVLDCTATGEAGHAARNTGTNAIYKAVEAIKWFESYHFEPVSDYLGPVMMTVTMINAGTQHNVIPDICQFVVDVRSTDVHSNREILNTVQKKSGCQVQARSTRLESSSLPMTHTLYKLMQDMKIETFGSPTLSDQALLDVPSLKIGPGRSERSHMPDEFIYLADLELGCAGYVNIITELSHKMREQ